MAVVMIVSILGATFVAPADAADNSKVKEAARRVEKGANQIGEGKVGEGAAEMVKGIGHTVVESAKFTGENIKEFFQHLFSSS
jgi:hypothetical protein